MYTIKQLKDRIKKHEDMCAKYNLDVDSILYRAWKKELNSRYI